MTDDNERPTLADTIDVLDDLAHTLWGLVDDVSEHHSAEDAPGRRIELRITRDHISQAWAQVQHATTTLRALVALAGPGCPDHGAAACHCACAREGHQAVGR